MVERKVRMIFKKYGWKTVRAGASLGPVDIICIKSGVCLLLQIKSTKKKKFYYYQYLEDNIEKLPFYLVVDFGYGKVRIVAPQKTVCLEDGRGLEDFLSRNKFK